MKQVITSWAVLAQLLEEHSMYRTYCARCGGHFDKNHALTMISQEYSIQLK